MKKIFISAGEQSGDLHGSNLIYAIHEKDPDIEIYGLGNRKMANAGMHCIHDMTKRSVMWVHAITKIHEFFKIFSDSIKFFKAQRPDLVILIDYCGFNFYLAKAAKKLGIPVMYYISPQIWAHGKWRVKKIKKLVDKMVVIYPFEEEIYREAGVPVKYVGNPIADELTKQSPDNEYIARLKRENGDNIIALLPGSRVQEIKKILPLLLKTSLLIHKVRDSVKFIVSCSEERHKELIENLVTLHHITDIPATIIVGNLAEIVKASKLCLTGSGTVTLKIAYYLTPMIIIYKISSYAYFIANPFIQSPFLSLVNKLADDFIVSERLMYRNDYKWLVSSSLELLDNDEVRTNCINNLQKIKQTISLPGASENAAIEALELIN